jgi:thioredoxin 1
MAGNVIEVTDDDFQTEVLEATEPVLVDFWAEWCGPCRAMSPVVEQLSVTFAGKAKVTKLNVDKAQTVAMNYGISAIPTMVIFKGGEPVKKFVGLTSQQDLQSGLEEFID